MNTHDEKINSIPLISALYHLYWVISDDNNYIQISNLQLYQLIIYNNYQRHFEVL